MDSSINFSINNISTDSVGKTKSFDPNKGGGGGGGYFRTPFIEEEIEEVVDGISISKTKDDIIAEFMKVKEFLYQRSFFSKRIFKLLNFKLFPCFYYIDSILYYKIGGLL